MSALVLYGLINLLFLALFVGALLWLEQPTHRLIVLALVVVASVGVTTLVFGVGNYWSTLSLVGKLAAAVGASACPPLCAWAAFSVARTATPSSIRRAVVAFAGGAAGVLVAPLVALGLACSLTGDCL